MEFTCPVWSAEHSSSPQLHLQKATLGLSLLAHTPEDIHCRPGLTKVEKGGDKTQVSLRQEQKSQVLCSVKPQLPTKLRCINGG